MRELIDGRRTPVQVRKWATRWITPTQPVVDDDAVWDALVSLSGADLEAEPGRPLYGHKDYERWLDQFTRAMVR